MDATTTYASGGFGEILLGEGDNATDITGALGAGELAGLVELRDRTLPNLHGTLDQLAADLRDSINRVHNRGVAFPGLQTVTGSRVFVQPSNQTISLGGGSDVAIVLFNSDGSQAAATTLETIMQSAAYGSGAQPAHGPWSIAEVTATVEDWLQANGAAAASVGVSSDGHVQINLASSSMHLAFRDQSGSAPGDAASDALILFDADGDGASDESVSGFSFFFGLNDFFTDQGNADLFQSAILSESFAASSATLTFHGPSGALGSAVVVSPGDSLEDIAALINQNVPKLTASVVPEDGGYRLRIKSGDGASFTVTEDVAGGNALIGALGLKLADTGVATGLTVHPDIAASPSLMARGVVHWDANQGAAGEYLVSAGDNTLVHQLVSVLATEAQFSKSGALGAMTTTLDGFAAALIGESAGLAESNQIQVDYRQGFADALKQKSDTLRGVNLDEEMGEMIVYQQAYAAAARIITTIQDMFDVLEQAFA
jgi:flagellar hook-associated protein 1 FlgK